MLFTTKDISTLGIKRERLRVWIDEGWVRPYIRARGPGTKNYFTIADIIHIKTFEFLVECGLHRRLAARANRVKGIITWKGVDHGIFEVERPGGTFIVLVNVDKIATDVKTQMGVL